MNKNNKVRFLDGSEVEKASKTSYLGATLTPDVDLKTEITSRLSKANLTFNRLKIFWRKTNCTVAWKLQVFNALIKSTLVYGLETLHITKAQCNRIHSFQCKALRNILNLKHTFIDRNNTNEFVINKANEVLSILNNKDIKILHISDFIIQQRIKFCGHLIRASDDDPTRNITFEKNSAKPVDPGKRRIGGPRKHWTIETLKLIWGLHYPQTPFTGSEEEYKIIYELAKNYNI